MGEAEDGTRRREPPEQDPRDAPASGGAFAPIEAALLARLGRRHRSAQERRSGDPSLTAELIARVLTATAAGRAVAVPAPAAEEPTAHPLGPDLRLIHSPASGRTTCQQRRLGAWVGLTGVAVAGDPHAGFEIDADALRRAVGRLDPELELALPGAPRPASV